MADTLFAPNPPAQQLAPRRLGTGETDAAAGTHGSKGGVWKWLYTDGNGVVQELDFGASGTVPTSSGTASAPSNTTPGPLAGYSTADENNTGTSLASSSYLVVTVAAAKYQVRAILFVTNLGATEGLKLDLGGNCSLNSAKLQISIWDDTTNAIAAFARVTALTSSVGAGLSSGDNYAEINGTIDVGAAGTFLIRHAQNAVGASAGVKLQIGSSLVLTRLS